MDILETIVDFNFWRKWWIHNRMIYMLNPKHSEQTDEIRFPFEFQFSLANLRYTPEF